LPNFTWQILCFANFYKYMQSKKRGHLQQFGIIHFPNPDLIYIRNPERNKIMFVLFHLLKAYIRNSSLSFIFFSPSHLEGNDDGNHNRWSCSNYVEAPSTSHCKISLLSHI
jgi:hypothetical protein